MKIFLLALFLLSASQPSRAQLSDSLRLAVGTVATLSAKDYQPLWLVANHNGTLTDQRADLATYVSLRNEHHLTNRPGPAADGTTSPRRGFYLRYGATGYVNNHFRDFFLAEGYAQAGYKTWQLRAGRYRETTGEVDPTLSSGSLGISGNALPVPKLELAVTEYTPVPFTKGLVQFRGQFAHGWLGTAGDIKKTYLHQKSFYLQVGRARFSVYGGLTHFAQWGGSFPVGRAPHRFQDYLRIIVGASGKGHDPVYQQGPIDVANAVGNHLLIPDFGLRLRHGRATFRLYTQTLFEKGIGDSANANRRDQLAGLKILSRDRLVGLSWERPGGLGVQKILVEGIYTKYQGGPIIYQGRDNYYNNGTYTMGWQYQNRILGTPLFINQQRARHYALDPSVLNGWQVVSNRIIGGHLGAKGSLTPRLDVRVLATYVQHYGNYYNDAAFAPARKQAHLLVEVPYRWPHATITAALGGDYGDLATATAGLLRLEWHLP